MQVCSAICWRHFPRKSFTLFHQLENVVGARPGSRAMPSVSTWSSEPSFSCVQATTNRLLVVDEAGSMTARLPGARVDPDLVALRVSALGRFQTGLGTRVRGLEILAVPVERELELVGA